MLISVAVNINLFQACVYETRFTTNIFDKVHSLLQAHYKYIIFVVGKIRTEIQKKIGSKFTNKIICSKK